MNEQIEVLYVNNGGGGYARKISVPRKTTLGVFVDEYVRDYDLDEKNARIRVNSKIEVRDVELQDGDRVTVTPTKVAGG